MWLGPQKTCQSSAARFIIGSLPRRRDAIPLVLGPSDYTLFDGQATITYTQVLGNGNVSVSVAGAVGMGPTRREVPAEGGYLYHIEQEWWLPQANMSGIVPAEGDHITDADGTQWQLQSDIETTAAGIAGTGVMYRVVTRQGR